jgi:phage-related protein
MKKVITIYVLHCFEKKTRSTSLSDTRIARKEYAQLEKYRQEQKKIVSSQKQT